MRLYPIYDSIFKSFLIFTGTLFVLSLSAQRDSIVIKNPSFEGNPTAGIIENGVFYTSVPKGWYDCGRLDFPGETPPDIHPDPVKGYFGVTQQAAEGDTYLGMVVRFNETWEAVSQRLSYPILRDQCYKFSISLMKSSVYLSEIRGGSGVKNFTTPIVLRIWGANGYCGRKELLAESDAIKNTDWETYDFEFTPGGEYRFIVLEAFYKTPTIDLYGGHLLMDNSSNILEIACEGEDDLIAAIVPVKEAIDVKPKPKKKAEPKKEIKKEAPKVIAKKEEPKPSPKKKLIAGLDRSKLKAGQTLRLENIYFDTNDSNIQEDSYPELEELYDFLKENKDIIVEIGGHTNGIPPHSFCDKLSKNRAKAVADKLIVKGISPKRVTFKGYGKRKRIATDRTAAGRKKNQRVEIKIMSIG